MRVFPPRLHLPRTPPIPPGFRESPDTKPRIKQAAPTLPRDRPPILGRYPVLEGVWGRSGLNWGFLDISGLHLDLDSTAREPWSGLSPLAATRLKPSQTEDSLVLPVRCE